MEKSSRLVRELLKDLSPHERKEAHVMFTIIGMTTYLQRHCSDVNLSGSMVKDEHAKCYSVLLRHYHQRTGQDNDDKIKRGKESSTTYKKSIDTSSKQTRRHDGLSHYPFVDEFGSVQDVLKEENATSIQPKVDAMVDPILKHTTKKVYDEFKIGQNGMRASDVPQALKGIRTQEYSYSFLQPEDSHAGSVELKALANHKLISLAQWTQIVRCRVRDFMKNGGRENISVQEDICDDDNNSDCFGDDEIYDEEEWITEPSTPTPPLHFNTPLHHKDNSTSSSKKLRSRMSTKSGDHLFQMHPRPASKKYPTQNAKSSVSDAALARHDALQRKIQSSVNQKHFKLPQNHDEGDKVGARRVRNTRAMILADKRHAMRVRVSRQNAAMRAIASSKVRYLPDHIAVENEDTSRPHNLNDDTSTINMNQLRKNPAGTTDLNSGSAALDIANAFLSGSLGKQLLQRDDAYTNFPPSNDTIKSGVYGTGRRDVTNKGESDSGANISSSILQGGQVEEKSDGTAAPKSKFALYSGRDKFESCAPLYDNKGNSSSTNNGNMDTDGKSEESVSYYADNWRSTKGGWVADFGAPHTHALSGKDNDSGCGFDEF